MSFGAPASNGGSTVRSYTVTATDTTTPANGGQAASGAASPITVTGLSAGDSQPTAGFSSPSRRAHDYHHRPDYHHNHDWHRPNCSYDRRGHYHDDQATRAQGA